MDKNYIKERLQEKNRRIRLPKAIEFKLDGGELRLTVSGKGVVANMQDNGSAFEGWAICIKSRMKEVEKVVVGWEQPDYSRDLKEKNRQQKHYNRFRLRAAFFEENYSWVSIAEKNKKEVEDVKKSIPSLVVNYPSTEASPTAQNDEAKLERELIENNKNMRHQLPVGLFTDEVLTENTFTPRGASQIDIWELEGNVLKIYELKHAGNKAVGIISELVYYANVMRLLVEGTINYPESLKNKKKDYRGEKALYKAVTEKEIRQIDALFLASDFHPLIGDNLENILNIMNQSKANLKVRYDVAKPKDLLGNKG